MVVYEIEFSDIAVMEVYSICYIVTFSVRHSNKWQESIFDGLYYKICYIAVIKDTSFTI